MAATKHMLRGGSKAGYDINCPGAATLRATVPDEPAGEAAVRGNAYHDAAEHALKEGLNAEDLLGMTWRRYTVTKEVIDLHLKSYIGFVDDHADDWDWFDVELFMTHPDIPDCGGTADLIYKKGRTLGIGDLKTGQNLISPKADSLHFYAAVAVLSQDLIDDIDDVELTIFQLGEVKQAIITIEELLDWHDRYYASYSDGESFNSGKHCTWCPAMSICPAKRAVAEAAFKYKSIGNDLATALEMIQELEPWIKEVKKDAEKAMMAGAHVEGWKVIETRPTRKWAVDDTDVLEYLGEAGLDLDAAAPRKVITPPQAEKLLGSVETEMVVSVSSGKKIAPLSDKSPALNEEGSRDLSSLHFATKETV